ncbi:helix-turn-helix domain-containing protein [Streptomyces sp. LP05-1]|uniref:Helix-turn-helix domain-containing protein n=1 Tax=Streptomyces pyxinae TaxID=2970734 RepID=A0ABT2CQB8_9ACTN|nr:metalloregulator ArsR/SmtB family transcription factor [Streptomyces sp. LP05-1]MCS0639456.1 helix-turn-helix domain-containing protein [Streptomyces sp. LP05-1]
MLRVHFTGDDLARVRVATAPDPLWEITNSFQVLMTEENPLAFGEWRRLVRPVLPPACRMLAALLPPRGYSPDFLTPDPGGSSDLPGALDTVLSTPRTVLRQDFGRLTAVSPRPLPAGLRPLAEGDPGALRRLDGVLRVYHRHALAGFWPQIRAHIDADLALRSRAVLTGGTEGLLASFRPVLRWRPPVLESDYPVSRELRLGGRGLLLQPSFFCVRRPVTLADPGRTPVLVYPIRHTPDWTRGGAVPGSAELGALLGHTRAAILEDTVTGRTTGELAARFGISAAAVSQHTAVLRQAGLLTSARHGRFVLHTITPAGVSLLESPSGSPPVSSRPRGNRPHP